MLEGITDRQVGLLVKAALEFNASLVGLAAMYYGNMNAQNAKRFRREYRLLFDEYRKQLNFILPEEV